MANLENETSNLLHPFQVTQFRNRFELVASKGESLDVGHHSSHATDRCKGLDAVVGEIESDRSRAVDFDLFYHSVAKRRVCPR